MLGKQLQTAAAGSAAGAAALGVEDVFSIDLFKNDGSIDVNNGIDLSSEGGLVVGKFRSASSDWGWIDSERGITKYLDSSNINAEATAAWVSSFDSNGWTGGSFWGTSNNDCVGWTFRKAPGFFDVVTYTGNGVAGRTISHNLGSVPGCIIVKCLSSSDNWPVYHQSVGATKFLILDGTNIAGTNSTRWNNTAPTSSVFTVGSAAAVNNSGDTYVAYLFAHDEAIFGKNADQSVIKCGSYTGNGSTTGPVVNLGWEPQWVLIKKATGTAASWFVFDNMRGILTRGNDAYLMPNLRNSEANTVDVLDLNATGFQLKESNTFYNGSGETYVYIAIRRGPMKTPTDATEVFSSVAYTGDSSGDRYISNYGFPLDLLWYKRRNGTDFSAFATRLQGHGKQLVTSTQSAEANISNIQFDRMLGFYTTSTFQNAINETGATVASAGFRRAHGFFDIVTWTGTGSATTVSHNLGVVPDFAIYKRTNGSNWYVQSSGLASYSHAIELNNPDAAFGPSTSLFPSSPTSTVINIGTSSGINASGIDFIGYLFGNVPGISKAGSYTGTGSNLNVDCGFSAGARFVLIKRTDNLGDWYVWDTARGIVSGNDPYLLLNSTAAEVTTTDYIDPYTSGFTVTSSAPAALNASGGTYLFLAIA